MKCCICKKEIDGYGNNPDGALDLDGNEIIWNPEDRCCDECNNIYVIPGRFVLLTRRKNDYVPKVDLHKEGE